MAGANMPTAVLLCAIVGLAGCDEPASQPAAATSASASASDGLSEGDEVVAAVAKAGFRQGTIVALTASEVTFAWGHPKPDGERPKQTVPREQVWSLKTAATFAPGDYASCKIEMTQREMTQREMTQRKAALPSWYPCQVEKPSAGRLLVVDHYGRKHELDPTSVIKPSADVQKNVGIYLAEEARHRSFDLAFEAAGRPPQPASWDPKVGDSVVIHFVGTSWYGGKVVENKRDKGKVRVSYDGGTWDDRDVPLREIAPIPSSAPTVQEGAFVITRPHNTTRRWEHNKVVSLRGDEVEVENRDEKRRTVKVGDLIVMAP